LHDFRKKKVIEHKMCVVIFLELLSETFLFVGKGRVKVHSRTGYEGPEGE